VLGRNQPKNPAVKEAKARGVKQGGSTAQSRAKARFIKSELASAEKAMAKLQARVSEIDRAMYEPANAAAHLADKTMSELLAQRALASDELADMEGKWLALGEELETVEGG